MPTTLGFMQVGHDQQTSTNCKSRLWFGQDKQRSTLVLKFTLYFQSAAVVGGRITIPNLHKALPVGRNSPFPGDGNKFLS
jgi:hypothetical protein